MAAMNRRVFLQGCATAGLAAAAGVRAGTPAGTRVALVKTRDRAAGIARAVDLLALPKLQGKSVFVKPNLNSADPPPGSTHLDALAALLRTLRGLGAGELTIGDRSGMGNTREVMEQKGIFRLAAETRSRAMVLDELPAGEWKLVQPAGSHWERGFALPQPALAAGAVVQLCCLKTHRFGGHFTLSLKNSVGLAAKRIPGEPHDYMRELHSSAHQRRMIAEINLGYVPALVVLDGSEAFTTGGPDTGRKVEPGVVLAGTDRVAIDAVGVAILREFGTTPEVSRGRIFDQEQIARAAELRVGVGAPESIELVTADAASAGYAARLRAQLVAGAG